MFGLIAPAAIPTEIRTKIQMDASVAVKSPEIASKLSAIGMEPIGSTSESFNKFIVSEIAKWRKVAKDNNIRSD